MKLYIFTYIYVLFKLKKISLLIIKLLHSVIRIINIYAMLFNIFIE